MIVPLEETFYVGETGFDFIVETGLDMSGLIDGQLRSVVKRPCGSIANRSIPTANVMDSASGTVHFQIVAGDLSMPGIYQAQVFVQDNAGRARPSHVFSFEVQDALVSNPSGLF